MTALSTMAMPSPREKAFHFSMPTVSGILSLFHPFPAFKPYLLSCQYDKYIIITLPSSYCSTYNNINSVVICSGYGQAISFCPKTQLILYY